MAKMRALIREYRSLAALLLLAALVMKAVVPAGFMVGPDSKILTVQYCGEVDGAVSAKQIVIPLEQLPDTRSGDDITKSAGCAFASLTAGAMDIDANLPLPNAPPLQLAMEFERVVQTNLPPPAFIKPPLRGPPAHI